MFISGKIELRNSKGGKGLFSKQKIRKGELILEFEKNFTKIPSKYTLQIDEHLHQISKQKDPIENYINHSCEPNGYVDYKELSYRALRDIGKDEELTIDYLTSDYALSDPFKCLCGEKRCRKNIRGFKFLALEEKRSIKRYLSPFLQKKLDEEEMKGMEKIIAKNFSLEHTLDSGQIFRYERTGEFFYITKGSRVIKIKQEGNTLHYKTSKKIAKSELKRFLGLDEDLPKILLSIDKDKLMNKAITKYRGLRLLRQDVEECLPSFIASAFSNIPKIKLSLNKMSEYFGEKIVFEGKTFYGFPKIADINDLSKLKKCSLGFRAERIYALRKLDKRFFERLRRMNHADAKKELMKLDGVGSKVADCVLLFSLGHHESFPTDVWIERVIARNYLPGKKTNIKMIEEFGKNYFGRYAGYAQQYLYHYVRNI